MKAVYLDVDGPVIADVHMNGNDTVGVIGSPFDDQGSIILVSIATTRSSNSSPRP